MSVLASRLSKSLSHLKTTLPMAALAVGLGLMMPVSAFAQHGGGGGGGHGGGGGGGHGGGGAVHGGGGFHGGGGYRGGWGHGGWGRGGWGYGGWGGFYGGFYPWYGYGYGWDGSYNPFWAYGPDDYYGAAPAYAQDPEAYGPEAGGYGPQSYGPQSQYYPPTSGQANVGGFYTWQVGVEGGTCNRPYIQQIAVSATGAQPGSLQVGAQLGGIPVQHVIGGRIGPRLDLTDQACATEALEHARIGTTVRWETSTGIPVTFQVTKTVNGQNGQNCRDYEATAQFGSHTDTVRNTACKGTDGAWRATR